jgi:hypothetical protein
MDSEKEHDSHNKIQLFIYGQVICAISAMWHFYGYQDYPASSLAVCSFKVRTQEQLKPNDKLGQMSDLKVLLKSLGTHIARSPHYHVLGPSLICLSPQVSLATKYLASCKYSIDYHFHTVSLEEHNQNSTHKSRERYRLVWAKPKTIASSNILYL